MKGSNPFPLWEDNALSIVGRKEEIHQFASFIDDVMSKQGRVLVINGGPGMGKSTMLRYFRSKAEKQGLEAPYTNVEKGEDESALTGKLYYEMVPGGTGAIPRTFNELAEKLEPEKEAVFFIDDIDLMKKMEEVLKKIINLLKSKWRKRSIAFVISSTKELKMTEDMMIEMKLKPFQEYEAREMINKALKSVPVKMGEECFSSIFFDTGGNPRLIKRICHDIYRRLRENEKIISKGHYMAYLPKMMSLLSREWFGKMYQETPKAEREILNALASKENGAHISDIARELEKPLGPVTSLTRRLLDSGQIIKVGRGKYKVFSRLYAKYVMQRNR